ncbi:Dyp-type peroxidase [Branchiibius sp. NY16-3462-2]|uniref:Dyp-type peroxidase n=1 Tax=Branchiibius sp. NY16-3462-2 TaxID=1807500 RepID=UPI000798D6BE|nr:Dyp-type peroxidase [Branchiibius sp. NY16-3462-2]KYH43143.1 peroxidase [Branchiibius sp. NY16-3462-2]
MASQHVLAEPATAAIFLVATIDDGGTAGIRDLLADLAGLTRSVAFRSPDDRLTCVAGVGSRVWDDLYGEPRPAGLHPFQEVAGSKHTAIATPGDLLFHLRARRMDLCFELARQISLRLAGLATVVDEVHGFKYFDQRDVLGFVDGTENPDEQDAVDAVTVGDEDPAFAGSSYVIVQKYEHDMAAWRAISVEEQERVIGRSKVDDIEMPDSIKPTNSHIALNVIEDEDGNELDIVRDNMVFGSIAEGSFGTYFIGYAKTPDRIERMLRNMFIGDPPGNYDRILDFSTVLTGNLFFVPTADFLEDQPSAPPTADGSLGIGSLK